jgi:hypothetical protein
MATARRESEYRGRTFGGAASGVFMETNLPRLKGAWNNFAASVAAAEMAMPVAPMPKTVRSWPAYRTYHHKVEWGLACAQFGLAEATAIGYVDRSRVNRRASGIKTFTDESN